MANTFKSYAVSGIGTTLTDVHTVAALTTSTAIGFSIANTTGSTVTVDATIFKGATDFYLVKGASIGAGGTLVVVGGDQKLVLETGNKIKVKSSSAASVDVVLSVLELT